MSSHWQFWRRGTACVFAVAIAAFELILPAAKAQTAHAEGGEILDYIGFNQVRLEQQSGTLRAICYCGIRVTSEAISYHAKAAVIAVFQPELLVASSPSDVGSHAVIKRLLGPPLLATDRSPSAISLRLAQSVFPSAKPRETALLTRAIQARFTLDEIVTLYLNRATFTWHAGLPVVGIEQAARLLFGKTAAELSFREAAHIIALLRSPQQLRHATKRREATEQTRNVLRAMATTKLITATDLNDSDANNFARGNRSFIQTERGYFIRLVRRELGRMKGLPSGEPQLQVFVAMDDLTQHVAEHAAELARSTAEPGQHAESAMVSLDYAGRIEALVGGKSYKVTPFDRAVDAKRQPGSAFKVFVYLAALETGLKKLSRMNDAPFPDQSWGRNYDNRYFGRITLTQALALSANSVARRVAEQVGLESVIAMARRLGVSSTLRSDPTLPLGTSEISLLELSGAYAAIANGGFRVSPHAVIAVANRNGQLLFSDERPTERVLKPTVVQDMRAMLRAVVEGGTGTPANFAGDAAGKTGTTQKSRDSWFVGFTRDRVVGVWLGRDDAGPLPGISGHDVARVWATFNADLRRYSK